MSVEAFLNVYGAVRLSQDYFDKHLEKLGPVIKLRRLFSLCENKSLADHEPPVIVLNRIVERRNSLVHPRPVEIHADANFVSGVGDKIPEVARQAVAHMDAFYAEFGQLDSDVKHHPPSPAGRDG